MSEETTHGPVLAGVVTAVVGFSSSFVVCLAGLTAVGATGRQAASGLLTLLVTQALGMLWLSVRYRMPITLAWSTPGAALLATTTGVTGGWSAAVGAFAATGVLIVLTALVPKVGDLVAAIPHSLARAMLAGVLLPLCLAPVTALVDSPAAVAPLVVTWLVLLRLAPRWAVPGALLVALVTVLATARIDTADLAPHLAWTTPTWSLSALVGIALPLYVVTMASQNVPGVAVMSGFGYRVPWRASLAVTGVGTVVGAPTGGHAINLAAISAALAAGPTAGPDPRRRWIASVVASITYLVLAVASTALATLVAAAADGVMQAAAGLALLGTLGAALAEGLADPAEREPAAATLLVAASGVSVLGIGAAFWALVAGLLLRWFLRAGRGADLRPSARTSSTSART
ncbi:benzoate/H(+) symporter BenE family transporter [Nocardioides nitrophenolicus]|uniref:benzoate/H(+) symporter BenE family transporter n=1 Tax=Nocardioides nitrophenolicus TaxID=60489 RepID=UPI00195BA38B|nr:benzoate/H(+) symporter BenE family transporter [Nocardioides nitrophenolicus]MBM7519231.1 benzoate membrane transport protein [Nocardioides nitrophenolicus]